MSVHSRWSKRPTPHRDLGSPVVALYSPTTPDPRYGVVGYFFNAVIAAAAIAALAMSGHGGASAQPADRQIAAGERVRGVLIARSTAMISASLPATITAIGPDTGGRFRRGDPLVQFDCVINRAELSRALAIADAATKTLEVKAELARAGSIAQLQALQADAERKKALAEARVAETRVAYCQIPAPYDGRVVRRIANPHETVAPRDPLIEIVDAEPLEVRAFVPSQWLGSIAIGRHLALHVDELDLRVLATVTSVGAAVDNVSQLIEIRARTADAAPGLLPGMSGRLEMLP